MRQMTQAAHVRSAALAALIMVAISVIATGITSQPDHGRISIGVASASPMKPIRITLGPVPGRTKTRVIARVKEQQVQKANVRRVQEAAWVIAVSKNQQKAAHPVQQHHSYVRVIVAPPPPVQIMATTSPSMCGWNDRNCWHHVGQTVGSINGMPCGGDLPSCCTLRFESGGNPVAQNPHSSASGLWQDMHDTWGGYAGVSEAKYASVKDQNDRNRILFAGGAGAHNWYGDGCYNGR